MTLFGLSLSLGKNQPGHKWAGVCGYQFFVVCSGNWSQVFWSNNLECFWYPIFKEFVVRYLAAYCLGSKTDKNIWSWNIKNRNAYLELTIIYIYIYIYCLLGFKCEPLLSFVILFFLLFFVRLYAPAGTFSNLLNCGRFYKRWDIVGSFGLHGYNDAKQQVDYVCPYSL